MNFEPKYFTKHFNESLVWLLPVSLIITTFIILFFGISEQVGRVKAVNYYLISEVAALKDKVNKPQVNVSDTPSQATIKVTYRKDSDEVKNVKAKFQKIDLTGKEYWAYTFENNTNTTFENTSFVSNGVYVVNYRKTSEPIGKSTEVLDLIQYDRDANRLVFGSYKLGSLAVMVNGKVILFNDFTGNTSTKAAADILKNSKAIPEDVRIPLINELINAQ